MLVVSAKSGRLAAATADGAVGEEVQATPLMAAATAGVMNAVRKGRTGNRLQTPNDNRNNPMASSSK
jgi:hypothetical protein